MIYMDFYGVAMSCLKCNWTVTKALDFLATNAVLWKGMVTATSEGVGLNGARWTRRFSPWCGLNDFLRAHEAELCPFFFQKLKVFDTDVLRYANTRKAHGFPTLTQESRNEATLFELECRRVNPDDAGDLVRLEHA